MMKHKNSIDKDQQLQQLPLAKLKSLVKKSSFIKIENIVEEPIPTYLAKDKEIQNLSITALKSITGKSLLKISIVEKVAKTGLPEKTIQKIERNKNKATLEEIIAYCKGLKIKFQDFLPEIFIQH